MHTYMLQYITAMLGQLVFYTNEPSSESNEGQIFLLYNFAQLCNNKFIFQYKLNEI
jgi:hypothetical protein